MKKRLFIVSAFLVIIASLSLAPLLSGAGRPVTVYGTGTTTRVSVASDGTQGNQSSGWPSLSADGRYVAFASWANLVEDDIGSHKDIFVHDRDADEDGIFDESGEVSTTRVSVSSYGTEGNDDSHSPSISADGRYVAFESEASNLVTGDSNNYCDTDYDGVLNDNCPDIFVHDRHLHYTTRVSVASYGTEGNDRSDSSSISADGRYVAFRSDASNLVEDDTNLVSDVFVHDRGVYQLVLPVKKTSTEFSSYFVTNLSIVPCNTIHLFFAGGYPDGLVVADLVDTLPASATKVHYLGAYPFCSLLPEGFVGDVVISSDQPITGGVWTVTRQKVYLPLVRRNY